jgi:hypothetical protein
MSPNGRRAWRKWAKSYRRWLNRDERRYRDPYEDEPLIHYRMTWFEAKKQFGPDLGHQNAKLFAARSLVGMTMGARKRLYQRIVDAFPTEGDAFLIDTEGKGVPIGWLLSRRLRPCPGCMECDPSGFASICDGSGVLPARRS